ncbi:MAG: hypothetical protein SGILL_010646, partial [Bacillariaceae sp.]
SQSICLDRRPRKTTRVQSKVWPMVRLRDVSELVHGLLQLTQSPLRTETGAAEAVTTPVEVIAAAVAIAAVTTIHLEKVEKEARKHVEETTMTVERKEARRAVTMTTTTMTMMILERAAKVDEARRVERRATERTATVMTMTMTTM